MQGFGSPSGARTHRLFVAGYGEGQSATVCDDRKWRRWPKCHLNYHQASLGHKKESFCWLQCGSPRGLCPHKCINAGTHTKASWPLLMEGGWRGSGRRVWGSGMHFLPFLVRTIEETKVWGQEEVDALWGPGLCLGAALEEGCSQS